LQHQGKGSPIALNNALLPFKCSPKIGVIFKGRSYPLKKRKTKTNKKSSKEES